MLQRQAVTQLGSARRQGVGHRAADHRAADHRAAERPARIREDEDHQGADHQGVGRHGPEGADVVREEVGSREAGDHRDAEVERCAVHQGRGSRAEYRHRVHWCQGPRCRWTGAEPVLDHSVRVVPEVAGQACSQVAVRIEEGGECHGPPVVARPTATARRPEAGGRAR
ncbi:hypothetical protein GCM10022238_24930 [Gordonia hankookensis]